ncbi:NACHT, LRR and PYD domains-containing protein 1 homolog isoform X2 [Lethenteron reissneri]|uniref:NACHT, LRR and PYD domains-containing protein 1 homolog isoform X2 n=1 Tax=Lethenteron reissneri TaxID=7753 RepID=UPI002AB63020|nr:NACHT, LRR and PYD domains-containing protein 1 homolog isoform X2 [Lethenteron reissneri]
MLPTTESSTPPRCALFHLSKIFLFDKQVEGCSETMYESTTGICCFMCSEGQYKMFDCSSNEGDSFCRQCSNGHYMDKVNNATKCNECSLCDANEEVDQPCNLKRDAICRCREGYYRHDISNRCEATGHASAVIIVLIIVVIILAVSILIYILLKRKRSRWTSARYTSVQNDDDLTRYNEYLKDKTEYIADYNFGKHILLENRFVCPLLFPIDHVRYLKEHYFMSRQTKHTHTIEDKPTHYKQLFDPILELTPRLVVLTGDPGIGKSTLCQKIVYDFVSGDLFHNSFKHVIFLRFKEINNCTDDISFRELLAKIHSGIETFPDLPTARDIIIVLDGLDEFRDRLDFNLSSSDPNKKSKVSEIIAGLIEGKLLKGASILLTTRKVSLDQLYLVKVDKYVEIVGFHKKEIQEYFEKMFPQDNIENDIYERVQQCDRLFNFCYIPAFCWIIALTFKSYFNKDNIFLKLFKSSTTTELLSKFLFLLLNHHTGKQTDVNESISSLANIAFWGIEKCTQQFEKKHLQEFNVNPQKLNGTFLSEIFKSEDILIKTNYVFFHESIQEFFAALTFYLPDPKITISEFIQRTESCDDGHYDVVKLFLCGLASEKALENLGDYIHTPDLTHKKILIDWLKNDISQYKYDKKKIIHILHCIFELQDEQATRDITGGVEEIDISEVQISSMDCVALSDLLSNRKRPIDTLNLSKCGIDFGELKRLVPAVKNCKRLILLGNPLGDDNLKFLAEEMEECGNLEVLDLQSCQLTNESISALQKIVMANSNVKTLRLCNNEFDATFRNLFFQMEINKNVDVILNDNPLDQAIHNV